MYISWVEAVADHLYQGVCWEVTLSFVGNTHPISQGFELALAIIFLKNKRCSKHTGKIHVHSCQAGWKKNLVWFSNVPRMTFKQGVGCELRVERHPGHGRWRACHPSLRLAPIWHTSSGNLNQAPAAGTDPVQVRRFRLLWEFFLPSSLAGCFNYK